MADPRAALLAWCDETERVARAATQPRWEAGDPYRIAGVITGDRCAFCDLSPPVWEGRRDINGTQMLAHVHRGEPYGSDIAAFDGAGEVWAVTSPNDWGSGIAANDAEHVVRHDPLATLRRVAAIRRVLGQHCPWELGSTCATCGAEGGRWPCTTVLELADGFVPGWRES